jgi:hypothetical protein
MKALVIISRVGQIVILAIAFMACVGWNQAAGLQSNISSITRKRIKDIVRIRYVIPYRSLHTVPTLCSNTSDTAFDSGNVTNDLNNSIWDSAGKQHEQSSCTPVVNQALPSKQSKTTRATFTVGKVSSLAAPAFCQSKQTSVTDAFQGQGYFSGFTNSSADFANDFTEESADNVSLASLDETYEPVYVVFGITGCKVTICHTKGNMSAGSSGITLLDTNSLSDDEYPVNGSVSQLTAGGCQNK